MEVGYRGVFRPMFTNSLANRINSGQFLEWAEGSVPTPWGPITMRVDREALQLHSPVPMRVILDGAETRLDAGTSTITRTAAS